MPAQRRAATVDDAAGAPARPEYRVEALAKGLRVLSLFTEQRPTWRVSDIAPATGLPLPTVYRVIMTLTAEGYLEHLPNGEYRPGVRVLTLGTAALRSMDLVEIATPLLQRLATDTGETVNLCVLTGDRVLYLVRLRNSDLVTANIQVGSTLSAVHTSIGKLLLAHLEPKELSARISEGSFNASHGPNAKTTMSELKSDLAAIRKEGWAMQDEELAFGLRSVAAPVRDATGAVVAGANVAVQSRDWTTRRILKELKPKVVETCRQISALLGHSGVSRLDKLHPDELDADQRTLYDWIANGPRAQGPQLFALKDEHGRLEGPFNAMLLSPRIGAALQEVGAAVRYGSSLSDRCREIAILAVGHQWRSDFEIYAHEAVGAAVGLTKTELDALRTGDTDAFDGEERLVAVTAATLAARGDLDDAEYAAAVRLGEAALFELLTIVGYYATLALQLRVFRVATPDA